MNAIGALAFYGMYLQPPAYQPRRPPRNSQPPPRQFSPPPTSCVSGFIHTVDNKPISDASVIVDGVRVCTTSAQGTFTHKLSPGAHNLQFYHDEYSSSQRNVVIDGEAGSASVDITLLNLKTIVVPAGGGKVEVPETDASVNISSSTLVDKDGKNYDGPVKVSIGVLNAEDPNQLAGFPGDFKAVSNGQEVLLESFGAVYTDLRDQNNNPLHLRSGATMQITIPSNALGDPDASLWWFNQSTGLWEDQGKNDLKSSASGQSYTFSTTRSGMHNVDKAVAQTYSSGSVYDKSGAPVAYATVWTKGLGYGGMTYAQTDAKGQFKIAVRENSSYEIGVNLGNYTMQSFGPFITAERGEEERGIKIEVKRDAKEEDKVNEEEQRRKAKIEALRKKMEEEEREHKKRMREMLMELNPLEKQQEEEEKVNKAEETRKAEEVKKRHEEEEQRKKQEAAKIEEEQKRKQEEEEKKSAEEERKRQEAEMAEQTRKAKEAEEQKKAKELRDEEEKRRYDQYLVQPEPGSTCNTLIPGPNAPGGCPKGAWSRWKCLNCGLITTSGNCSCSKWPQYGWVCLNHR